MSICCAFLALRLAGFVRFGSELEEDLWKAAAKQYDAAFPSMLDRAIGEYRRRPGLDELARIYAVAVGSEVLDALVLALTRAGISRAQDENDFVEIRYGLRWYIARHLQRRLIDDGYATPEMHDDFFATDLGL